MNRVGKVRSNLNAGACPQRRGIYMGGRPDLEQKIAVVNIHRALDGYTSTAAPVKLS